MIPTSSPDQYIVSLFSLTGRVAIVTGASRGIGWSVADGLARAGASVFAIARSTLPEKPLAETCRYISGDVRDEATLTKAVKTALANSARIDILVNSAGITRPGAQLADFDETLSINLRAPLLAMRAVEPAMREARRGSIINVTSLAAHRGFPGNPGYAAAKGGLCQLTRAMALDLGPSGIRVNNLVPGYIATAMTAASHADPQENKRRSDHTMLGRWGVPGDLIGATIFLASDAAAYVTGQDIVIDGGWLAKGLT